MPKSLMLQRMFQGHSQIASGEKMLLLLPFVVVVVILTK